MDKQLILCVGLPRSGKSTWAQSTGLPMVNPDSIRLALHGQPFLQSMEPYVWAIAKTMVQSLFRAGHDKIILDATNLTSLRRAQWNSPEWKVVYKEFDTERQECIERAMLTHQEYLIPVIHRMHKSREPLSEFERLNLYNGA